MHKYFQKKILQYPRLIPFLKKWLRIFRIRQKDRLISSIIKDRSRIKHWIEDTISIHQLYKIKERNYIIKNYDIYFQSDYNVYFKYINNFGLRNLEFNGTNDRLQLEFILNNIVENSVVFDIGASYGYYSLTIAKVKKRSRCFAFEPSQICVNAMNDNIHLNKLNNVSINDSAVGSHIGYGRGAGKKNKFGIQYVATAKESDQPDFKITTIDTYVNDNEIDNIDFIKIDIEGAELSALKGGEKSIAKFRPIVQCELSNNFTMPRYGYYINDIFIYFQSLDYTYAFINKEKALYEYGGLDWSTGSFEEDSNKSYEFFFIPKELVGKIDISTRFTKKIKKPYAV